MTKKHDELIDILTKDHNEVKSIFQKLEKEKDASGRKKLVKQLQMEIEPHMAGEEEGFYPALKKNEKSTEAALESLEEHHVTKMVLNELMDLPGDAENFKAKASVLQELVNHHIEEEEGRVFKIFREMLSSDEAEEVKDDFQAFKSRKKKAME